MAEQIRPVVCILAYNEEARIAHTIDSIVEGNRDTRPIVRVYANGCTDRTHEIVRNIANVNRDVELIELEKPSKPNAWNKAFHDNENEVLLFADADVTPGQGAVRAILDAFDQNPEVELACCESWPELKGMSLEQKLTGLMQIPLKQDFLIGHFYGIRRQAFVRYFAELGTAGLPEGIAGDDAFIDHLVPRKRFRLVDVKVKYQPPTLDDYYRYLARIRWQNEQIKHFAQTKGWPDRSKAENGRLTSLAEKLITDRPLRRTATGVLTTTIRLAFKGGNKNKIEAAYVGLGPVGDHGASVLSQATRSQSVK